MEIYRQLHPRALDERQSLSPTGVGGSLFSRLSRQQLSIEKTERGPTSFDFLSTPRSRRQYDSRLSPIHTSDSLFDISSNANLDDSNCNLFAAKANTPKLSTSRVDTEIEFKTESEDSRGNRCSGRMAVEKRKPDVEPKDILNFCHRNNFILTDTRESAEAVKEQTYPEQNLSSHSCVSSRDTCPSMTGRHQNDSRSTLQTNSSSKKDEWREVIDPESGRTYYYNRRSRVSKWKLPRGAVLAKPKKSSNKCHHSIHYSSDSRFIGESARTSRDTRQNGMLLLNESNGRSQTSSDTTHLSDEGINNDHYRGQNEHFRRDGTLPEHDGCISKEEVTSMPETLAAGHISCNEPSIDHLKSPQDCNARLGSVFCMFCGVDCPSVTALCSHFTQCYSIKQVQSSTLMELEKVIVEIFSVPNGTSLTKNQTEYGIKATHADHSIRERSLMHNQGLNSKPSQNNPINAPTANRSAQSTHNERNTWDLTEKRPNSTPNQQYQRKNVSNYCIEVKKCPFCEDEFNEGNQFSSHLLKCPERRRLRSRRRAKKKENPAIECLRSESVTPGRKLPWE